MSDAVEIEGFLRSLPPFGGLGSTQLTRLAELCREERYPQGYRIITKGDAADAMYIIREGETRVVVTTEEGRPKFSETMSAGEFFGEMAFLTGDERRADVFAELPTRCIVIGGRPEVETLLNENPGVAAFLTKLLGERLLRSGQITTVGRIHLVGELGRGGMAIVYDGVHLDLGRPVAIKMLSHELAFDRVFCERFQAEAKIIAQLEHPNIVRVYDLVEAYATYFIVMEKIDGVDLDEVLEAKGRLPYDEVALIVSQVASALDHAHRQGIVHRDVKPANVLLTKSKDVKLMDFGIAQGIHEEVEDAAGVVYGTCEYLAPEVVYGHPLDGRTDIYSLGVMTYELLTGELPFHAEDARDWVRMHLSRPIPDLRKRLPDVPPQLAEFVQRACQKKPEDRYADCHEIVRLFRKEESAALRGRTLTIFYGPESEGMVDAALTELTRSVRKASRTRVVASDLGEIL